MVQNLALNILLTVFIVVITVTPVLFFYFYLKDKSQSQHSVLRNFPLLGRIRYIFEMMGPELRQYMFDGDMEGRPFSRTDFANIVVAGKYLKTLIAFGSKRDFNQSGWYLKNDMFPKLAEEMHVDCEPKIKAKANIRFCETFLCSVASVIYLK